MLTSSLQESVSHLWCEHFYRLLSSRCDTEKGEMGGKRHWTDNREWCQQLYSLRLLALSWPAQAEERLQGPPLTPLPPH
jgi:hypothetical protein